MLFTRSDDSATLMSTRSKTFALFFTSLLITLLLLELIIRLFVPVRNVGPSFTEYDPTYGKSHKKNFSCTRITPEFTMQLTTNSLGFRGPEPPTFPSGGILFLGDSFTEGYGVNDGEEYPALVRREVERRREGNAIPVLNCGQGDIGNGRWLKFLRNEGDRFAPRLIFLQVMSNDFLDNGPEAFFSLNGDSLIEHAPSPPSKLRVFQQIVDAVPGLSYSYLIGFLRQVSWILAKGANGSQPPERGEVNDRLTYRLIDTILAMSRHKGWKIAVLFVGLEGEQLEKTRAIADAHDVPIVETPQLRDRPDLFFKTDGHWNTLGHDHVARQVIAFLDSSGILSE
jgi:hypothetical protein